MRRLAVKIFLVEDDFALAKLVKEAIEKYNFEVFPSTNFQALDQEFLEVQPDLVLMDINLPYFECWQNEFLRETNHF
jgi:DNA-binding response OmpR family regulator